MTRKQNEKPWTEMTTEELDRMAAEFDEEFVADTFQPLTPEKRAQWERARKKGRRPAKDNGGRIIAVHVDEKLLGRCEALAKKLRISRDLLVARGLKAILAAHEEES